MVKMLSFMLCIFYHNNSPLKKELTLRQQILKTDYDLYFLLMKQAPNAMDPVILWLCVHAVPAVRNVLPTLLSKISAHHSSFR